MESNENSLYEFYLENILSHLLKQADILQMKSWKLDEIFLSSDGQYGPFKFINMCVSDSLLTTLYNCYLRTDQVRSLFDSHKVLRAAMFFVGAQMYNEAKACWLFAQIVLYKNLKITKEYNTFTKQFEINARSEPADHLHTFNELVLGICHFDEGRNSPSLSQEILYKTLSKFESLGDVLALGLEEHHPIVILVDVDLRMETAPPLTISDSYDRVYELQYLLMTRKSFPEHVIVGLRCSDGWALYDDLQSEYGHFNPENADFIEDFFIIFAVYVDIPQDEVFDGGNGTRVFNHPSYNGPKAHQD